LKELLRQKQQMEDGASWVNDPCWQQRVMWLQTHKVIAVCFVSSPALHCLRTWTPAHCLSIVK
jgi:hypothetical protein